MELHSYKELVVWKKSVELTISIYHLTEFLPENEKYGLKSQMRRGAISIPSNIAEGRSRVSRKDFCRFLSIAHGSASELETQLEIVRRLSFVTSGKLGKVEDELSEIKAMLGSMIRKLNPIPP